MSRKGDTYPNLRSRKPKMVPYVHSLETAVSTDLRTAAKQTKLHHTGLEDTLVGVGERKAVNGEVFAENFVEIDDKGGGREIETDAGDLGLGAIAETSFVDNGADTQPLLGTSESEDDGVKIEIIQTEDTGETSLQICLQVTLPYIIAGFGMVLAGIVLDIVQVHRTVKLQLQSQISVTFNVYGKIDI